MSEAKKIHDITEELWSNEVCCHISKDLPTIGYNSPDSTSL
jgi:hypothetical protein